MRYVLTKIEKIKELTGKNFTFEVNQGSYILKLQDQIIVQSKGKRTFESKLDLYLAGINQGRKA